MQVSSYINMQVNTSMEKVASLHLESVAVRAHIISFCYKDLSSPYKLVYKQVNDMLEFVQEEIEKLKRE